MEWRKYGNHHILSSSSPSPSIFQLHQIILATIRCSDYGPPSDGTSCCFSLPGSPIPCSSTRIDLLPPMVPIIDPAPMSGLPSTIYDHTPWCSGFFKSAWNLLGAETVNAIKSFFSAAFLPSAANSTILTLVPKRPGASAIGDFRPISCCNTLYKAISKLLVHCLKPLLPDLILPNQTAFVQGRLLVENTVLATLYIRWLEACVCTASFSVGYNGTVQGYFKSKRGLRQGDPLSPYLFVVAMNCLSTLLNNAATEGRFGYHQNCEDSKLTHLCFADDLLIFTKGDKQSVKGVLEVLNEFERHSGLGVSLSKNCFFTCGLPQTEITEIAEETGLSHGTLPIRYLGVPLCGKGL